MKKNLVLMIGLFLILFNGNLWGAQPADLGAPFAMKPANVVVVAKLGGDYTSISAALAAINPTADNPYLVQVMPGVYNESVTMKSYVHLQGGGRDVTSIICDHVINVMISGFDLEGDKGIYISGSSPTIFNNLIKNNGNSGIYAFNSSAIIKDNVFENAVQSAIRFSDTRSSPVISNNKITGGGNGIGISGASSTVITNNIIRGVQGKGIDCVGNSQFVISDNLIEGNGTGISGSCIIKNNVIRNNILDGVGGEVVIGNTITGNGRYGIVVSPSQQQITQNKITANSISDINLLPSWPGSVPSNISFNVFDTISGSGAVGNYNLKSDGTAAPLQ